MKIAVMGAGGVGGYFGGRLAQAGEEVTFVARSRHVTAIQANGLHVESINGNFHVWPKVTADPKEVGIVDVVLVAVKAWQVPEAAQLVVPLLGENTIVVPLQNGVEAARQLSAVVGSGPVLGGLCKIISAVKEPGVITHSGADPYVAFGELHDTGSTRAEPLFHAFKRAKVTVELSHNILLDIWKKFLLIAAWSGVGAVTRSSVGSLRSHPETRSMLEQAMAEIVMVARAEGVQLEAEAVAVAMDYLDSLPPHATASMQRDIMNGLPSELEAQTGAVIRLAKHHNLSTPVNIFIYTSLYLQELHARARV